MRPSHEIEEDLEALQELLKRMASIDGGIYYLNLQEVANNQKDLLQELRLSRVEESRF